MATADSNRKSSKKPVADEIKALAQNFTIRKGQVFATSIDVATRFEKKHFHVLRAIRNLECSEHFRQSNFGFTSTLVTQPNGGKREEPFCELTRDGFTMLAFGFTGAKAVEWREKYIAAFNWMEQELQRIRQQQLNPDWQQQRLEARVEFRLMNATLKMVREHQGKKTAEHHYSNEARLINFALTGDFKPVDRTALNAADLALLAKLELKNTLLMGLGQTYNDRKATLHKYAAELRTPALNRENPPLALAA
jgi:Rha family phage regulatory protein